MTNTNQTNYLDEFKENKTKILLLHKDLYEGINIFGARQLHILEPVINYDKSKQLFARISRFKSHYHLPVEDRNCTIYIHHCTYSKLLLSGMTINIKLFLYYLKNEIEYPYLDFDKYKKHKLSELNNILSNPKSIDDYYVHKYKTLTAEYEQYTKILSNNT
jgi:hypothetical protein